MTDATYDALAATFGALPIRVIAKAADTLIPQRFCTQADREDLEQTLILLCLRTQADYATATCSPPAKRPLRPPVHSPHGEP